MKTGACCDTSLNHDLSLDRIPKLISTGDASLSLDKSFQEDTYLDLWVERSGVTHSLQDFRLDSPFQTAFETLVLETSQAEDEEDLVLKDIAATARRLEKLELKAGALFSHVLTHAAKGPIRRSKVESRVWSSSRN